MPMKKFITILFSITFALGLHAQNHDVKGRVTDEGGEALPGAIVVVKDSKGATKSSALSDDKGYYTIKCSKDDVVEFYFLGFDDVKIKPEGRQLLDVVMSVSASTKLDDVVVIGYGSVKKSDLTGSVANVKMGDVRDAPVTSIDQAIQGRVAGADIMSTSGEPGATTSIRIRGTRSIEASNEPLIVVDGIIDAVSDLNDINPADIESISILKDASSTAIYGARGSNGVILITTKSATDVGGALSNFSVTLKASAGFSQLPSKLDIMDGTEFALYRTEYAQRSATTGAYTTTTPVSEGTYNDPYAMGAKTIDWIDYITRTAPYQAHVLSLNGFTGTTKYLLSVSYVDNQGIIRESGEQRLNVNFNASTSPFKWLTLGARLYFADRWQDDNLASIGGTSYYNSAIYLSPFTSPTSKYNSLSSATTKYSNPGHHLTESTKETDRMMFKITGWAEAKFLKDFKFKTQISTFKYERFKGTYNPSTLPNREDGLGGYAYKQDYMEEKLSWDNTVNYSKTIQNHSVSAMIGSAFYDYGEQALSVSGQGYLVDEAKWNNLGAVQDKNTLSVSSSEIKKRTLSFFGRVNYDYDKRYYITATLRGDGASNFAAGNKWGFFPSMALRWNISNEKFMRRISQIDELALKVSIGRSGNDAISAYRSLGALASVNNGYVFGGNVPVGFRPDRLDSPNLTWEKTDLYNIALTGSFFNSRLSFDLEGYYSNTTDLLLWVQVPHTTGYYQRLDNLGSTKNSGIEFSIESRNIVKRNFSWTTSFTISHNKQMVGDIGTEDYVIARKAPETDYMMYGYVKGYPLNSLWGFKYAGVWKSPEEIERNKITKSRVAMNNKALGYPTYVDKNHDGNLDADDLCYLGNADPVIYGGLQNTFRLGKFSLGVFFAYSLGGKIFNYSELYMSGSRRTNQYRYMLNAWHPEKNPNSDLPAAGVLDGADLHSDRQVHDASYLRLKNVTLGYTLNVRSKVLKEVKFAISGENLYLWKNYNGFDPDVSSESDKGTIRRMDLGAYPKPRTVIFSVQLKY